MPENSLKLFKAQQLGLLQVLWDILLNLKPKLNAHRTGALGCKIRCPVGSMVAPKRISRLDWNLAAVPVMSKPVLSYFLQSVQRSQQQKMKGSTQPCWKIWKKPHCCLENMVVPTNYCKGGPQTFEKVCINQRTRPKDRVLPMKSFGMLTKQPVTQYLEGY